MPSHEYEVGLHKSELDTPALLLDLAALEQNLARMARFFAGRQVALRPHVKLHKATPILAHKQLAAGGVGLTCAKLAEAETLAAAGIRDILIANQVVGARKAQRLAALAGYTEIKVAVDNAENVAEIGRAAAARGATVGILVEVDIGNKRCGVEPFGPTLALARTVASTPGLRFLGLMGYDGHCTVQVEASEREAASLQANRILVETRRYLEDAGMETPIVSASGTFTYRYAASLPGITEIQAGTYLLMDTFFKEKGVTDFEPALTVLATVISRAPRPDAADLAILDLGRKGISIQYGFPEVKHPCGATAFSMPQEHTRLRLSGEALDLKVGDKVELWVRDANETVNLYDAFYAMRGDTVEAVWEIPGRGRMT